jgi:hypothetical protein
MSKSDEPAKAAEGFPVFKIITADIQCYHCGKTITVRARTISDDQRQKLWRQLWQMMDDSNRGYVITANQIGKCLETLK